MLTPIAANLLRTIQAIGARQKRSEHGLDVSPKEARQVIDYLAANFTRSETNAAISELHALTPPQLTGTDVARLRAASTTATFVQPALNAPPFPSPVAVALAATDHDAYARAMSALQARHGALHVRFEQAVSEGNSGLCQQAAMRAASNDAQHLNRLAHRLEQLQRAVDASRHDPALMPPMVRYLNAREQLQALAATVLVREPIVSR